MPEHDAEKIHGVPLEDIQCVVVGGAWIDVRHPALESNPLGTIPWQRLRTWPYGRGKNSSEYVIPVEKIDAVMTKRQKDLSTPRPVGTRPHPGRPQTYG